MNSFWDNIWSNSQVNKYKKYIDLNVDYPFIEMFKDNNVTKICDAGCGFGKYSTICSYNSFQVYGFDVSEEALNITKEMLQEFKLEYKDYKVCSITDIYFEKESFDGVVAHSVIDHLIYIDALKAVKELKRIAKVNGLIYATFDGLEEDDIEIPHILLEDGSFKYNAGKRNGMIFRYYSDYEIKELFKDMNMIYFNTMPSGVREIIVKK